MKEELRALIAALEADAFNVSTESITLRSGLLERAKALDTLDEEQLSRAVTMTREHFEKEQRMFPLGDDGQLAAAVLELLDGETVDEDEEEGL